MSATYICAEPEGDSLDPTLQAIIDQGEFRSTPHTAPARHNPYSSAPLTSTIRPPVQSHSSGSSSEERAE